jgi:hypothetical protein
MKNQRELKQCTDIQRDTLAQSRQPKPNVPSLRHQLYSARELGTRGILPTVPQYQWKIDVPFKQVIERW